jgi:hypothetical protein
MGVESINKDGERCWREIKAKYVKAGGETLKIIVVGRGIHEGKIVEENQTDLIQKLTGALAQKDRLLKELRILRSFLPIRGGCKRIRDENGRWWPLDLHAQRQTRSKTHPPSARIAPVCSIPNL